MKVKLLVLLGAVCLGVGFASLALKVFAGGAMPQSWHPAMIVQAGPGMNNPRVVLHDNRGGNIPMAVVSEGGIFTATKISDTDWVANLEALSSAGELSVLRASELLTGYVYALTSTYQYTNTSSLSPSSEEIRFADQSGNPVEVIITTNPISAGHSLIGSSTWNGSLRSEFSDYLGIFNPNVNVGGEFNAYITTTHGYHVRHYLKVFMPNRVWAAMDAESLAHKSNGVFFHMSGSFPDSEKARPTGEAECSTIWPETQVAETFSNTTYLYMTVPVSANADTRHIAPLIGVELGGNGGPISATLIGTTANKYVTATTSVVTDAWANPAFMVAQSYPVTTYAGFPSVWEAVLQLEYSQETENRQVNALIGNSRGSSCDWREPEQMNPLPTPTAIPTITDVPTQTATATNTATATETATSTPTRTPTPTATNTATPTVTPTACKGKRCPTATTNPQQTPAPTSTRRRP